MAGYDPNWSSLQKLAYISALTDDLAKNVGWTGYMLNEDTTGKLQQITSYSMSTLDGMKDALNTMIDSVCDEFSTNGQLVNLNALQWNDNSIVMTAFSKLTASLQNGSYPMRLWFENKYPWLAYSVDPVQIAPIDDVTPIYLSPTNLTPNPASTWRIVDDNRLLVSYQAGNATSRVNFIENTNEYPMVNGVAALSGTYMNTIGAGTVSRAAGRMISIDAPAAGGTFAHDISDMQWHGLYDRMNDVIISDTPFYIGDYFFAGATPGTEAIPTAANGFLAIKVAIHIDKRNAGNYLTRGKPMLPINHYLMNTSVAFPVNIGNRIPTVNKVVRTMRTVIGKINGWGLQGNAAPNNVRWTQAQINEICGPASGRAMRLIEDTHLAHASPNGVELTTQRVLLSCFRLLLHAAVSINGG